MAPGLKIGLIADTHGVFDPAAAALLQDTQLLLHAGDVGHHVGHEEVLRQYTKATDAPVLAVAGNVDDNLDGPSRELLPGHRLVTAAGWRVLLLHEVAPGPQAKVCPDAADLIEQYNPDIVVFGHSHKAASWQAGNVCFINPGSVGPARFRLPRTVATMWLPYKPQEQAASEMTATAALDAPSLAGAVLCSGQAAGTRFTEATAVAEDTISAQQANKESGRHHQSQGLNSTCAGYQDSCATALQPHLQFHALQSRAPKRMKQSKAKRDHKEPDRSH